MNPRQIYFPILLTFLVLLACPMQEPSREGEGEGESIQALIDKALSPAFGTDRPGAAVISAVDGEIVFRKGYGLANLEQGVPLEPDMVFRVASITKEFTAVLVMQLVEEGVISLEDEITDFLPDYPVQGHCVTLKHLLSHTSGIRDFHDLPAFQNHVREDHTLERTLAIFKNEPFDFSPGERFSYTSSGYLVLGAILEQVTGKTYEQLLREKIFDVIGMESASLASHDEIIPKRVNGYTMREGTVYNMPISSMTMAYSGGGLMMSVDDLAVWDEALYGNELLNEQSKKMMWSPGTLNSGRATEYGLGWYITRFLGHKMLMHDGSIDGFLSTAMRLPDEHIFVAVLMNSDSPAMGPNVAAKKVLALLLRIPEKQAISLSHADLDKYTGDYIRKDGRIWKISAEAGRLFIAPRERIRFEIFPESETSFFFQDDFNTVTFEFNEEGAVTRLVFTLDTGDQIRADKAHACIPTDSRFLQAANPEQMKLVERRREAISASVILSVKLAKAIK